MPAIYLVRHGQASFGSDDYDVLSELGHRQAAVAGAELARRGVRNPVVISGALQRQRDTAAAVARELGVTVAGEDPRWNEIDAHAMVDARLGGPGASGGLTSAAFQEHLDAELMERIGGDHVQWRAFADGVMSALAELASGLPRGSDAVVATSAAVIATAASNLLSGTGATVVALNRVSVNASITSIASSARRMSLLSVNDHAHLVATSGLLTYR